MSVDKVDYLMWAANIDPDQYDIDEHEDINEFDIVYDGMCGKYCMVGKIIAESDEYGFEEIVDLGEEIKVDKEKYFNDISKYFDIENSEFTLKLFSHYS